MHFWTTENHHATLPRMEETYPLTIFTQTQIAWWQFVECSCPQWCSISTSVVFYRLIVILFILTLYIWIISPSKHFQRGTPKPRVTRLGKPFYTLEWELISKKHDLSMKCILSDCGFVAEPIISEVDNMSERHPLTRARFDWMYQSSPKGWCSGSECVFLCIWHEWSFLFKRRRGNGTFMSAVMFLLSSVCVFLKRQCSAVFGCWSPNATEQDGISNEWLIIHPTQRHDVHSWHTHTDDDLIHTYLHTQTHIDTTAETGVVSCNKLQTREGRKWMRIEEQQRQAGRERLRISYSAVSLSGPLWTHTINTLRY